MHLCGPLNCIVLLVEALRGAVSPRVCVPKGPLSPLVQGVTAGKWYGDNNLSTLVFLPSS